jgi:hypothetical protein
MNERDRISSVSWIFAGTTVSSFVGILLILVVVFYETFVPRISAVYFTYVGFIIAREIIVLLFILNSMLRVNSTIDGLLEAFAEKQVREVVMSTLEDNDQDTAALLPCPSEELQVQLVQLLLFIRDHKIGTTVWSYRPSKFALLIQISSIVTLAATTMLRIVIVNIAA